MKTYVSIVKQSSILFLFLIIYQFTSAQDQRIVDSIKLKIKTSAQDTIKAELLLSLGDLYEFTVPDTALYYYEKALDIANIAKSKKHIAKSNNYIGIWHVNQGRFNRALEYYLVSLALEEELGNTSRISKCNLNIGNVHIYQGNYDKAISYYLESTTQFIELGDMVALTFCYVNIGTLYRYIGSNEKALSYFNKSLEINLKTDNAEGAAYDYFGIATVFLDQGKFDNAIEYYLMALEVFEKLESKIEIAKCYHNIGIIYKKQDSYNEAIEYYLKTLEVFEELDNIHSMAEAYSNLALLHANIADTYEKEDAIRKLELDKAIFYANKLMDIGTQTSSKPLIIGANHILAIINWSINNNESSEIYFNNLINIINTNILLNFTFISEQEKENYLTTIKQYYFEYNSFALDYKSINPSISEMVYNNTVKNKGLLLKSNTAMRNAVQNSNDTLLIHKYDDWLSLKKQIAEIYSLGEGTKELETQANEIEVYLVKNSQEFSELSKIKNISWKAVQSSLLENEIALEFLHFPLAIIDSSLIDISNTVQYVALIISPNCKYPEMISIFTESEYEECINNSSDANFVAQLYGEKRGIIIKQFDNDYSNYADSLYSIIWSQIDPYLSEAKTIYYSPSGLLHNISFAAIPYNDSLLLSDKYNLRYLASTGNIVNKKSHKDIGNCNVVIYGGLEYDIDTSAMILTANEYKNSEFLLAERSITVGDSTRGGTWNYLSGTLNEAENIKSMFDENNINTILYSGENGLEESFKALSGNDSPEIIHIATHGFFFPDPDENIFNDEHVFSASDNPLIRSGLIMSGANRAWNNYSLPKGIDDGILTAYEVSDLNLYNTELVVLSACETGLGEIKGNEGVYGLQRSFKMAGVNYLIMSLWKVPDLETSEFMTMFYKNLLEGQTISNAFQITQKFMRNKYDPYYWAAFVLIE